MGPSPFIIHTGFISIRWYGFLIALAICISYFLILRIIKKENIDEGKFDSIFLITVLAGVVGARMGFVVQNTNYFSGHLSEMFAFWDGGLSIHGAIILGVLALYFAAKIYKINFPKLANIVAPYLMLSGAIGRWGNYFNQEIIGKPSSTIFKMFVPPGARPEEFAAVQYFHPVFLYESVLLFLGFMIYLVFAKKLKNYALTYVLIAYSAIRIIVEFYRIDYKPIFLYFDLAQLVSFGIIIVTVLATLTFRKK